MGAASSGSHLALRLLAALAVGLFTGATGSAPAAPVVPIGDADGDGRFTGTDVRAALLRCRPGCVLRALPERYDDVEVVIGPEFTRPVVVEGAGIGRTVFRSPVPVGAPVFWVRGGPANLVFRNFSIDGRKSQQPAGAASERSIGIWVATPTRRNSPRGRVEGVEAAHLMTGGIVIRDGAGWVVADSLVHDIGCHTDLPCPAFDRPVSDPFVGGRQTVGYGINLQERSASGARVRDNRVWNVSKIGIQAFTHDNHRVPRERLLRDVALLRNRVSHALAAGIVANGAVDVRIEGNHVEKCGGRGLRGNGGAGIACAGSSWQVAVRANTVRANDGSGLRLQCAGDDLQVAHNQVEGNCTRRLADFAEVQIEGRAGRSRRLGVRANDVAALPGGAGCAWGLLVLRRHGVVLEAGRYRGGSRATLLLADSADLELRDVLLENGSGLALQVRRDVAGLRVLPGARIRGGTDGLAAHALPSPDP